jgi:CubicO group peptidase (beta-lactamase class C family)
MTTLKEEFDPAPTKPQPTTQFESGALSRLDDWLAEQVSSKRIAGGCIGVMREDQTHVITAGELHLDSGVPVARNTIFRIYSMTKPVTSVAVMMLYERGLLQLDDPLAKYIPAFENMQVAVGGSYPDFVLEPAKTPITIHQLLTHTSGLTYWWDFTRRKERRRRARKKKECEGKKSCTVLFFGTP